MPIIDLQKRARELGRIRIGQVVETRNGKTRPDKLDRFRLTSPSKPLLDKVAELYGGTVTEWQPQGGGSKAWEVLTDARRIPILVPPNPVTQWMEHWTGGGCKRRCDGSTEVLSDSPCICKAMSDGDPDEPPLCKPTTRLNVVLRDVEGIGVWRLETHGWNAAIELPDVATFLAQAGGYVDGFLALEERTSKAEKPNGEVETRRFMVPTIEVAVTPAELMAGKGRITAPAVEGPVQRQALEAGPSGAADVPDYLAEAQEAATADAVTAIWHRAKAAGHMNPELHAAIGLIGQALKNRESGAGETPPADRPAEPDLNKDVLWQQILAVAGGLDWDLSIVTEDFAFKNEGLIPADATPQQLDAYLADLQKRAAA
jgi:hypothetical protein